LERGKSGIEVLKVPRGGKYVGSVEFHGKAVRFSGDSGMAVRYYDGIGKEMWSVDLCCDTGGSDDRIYTSEDGEIVVVTDTGEGGECISGEDLFAAPSGCVGLRVFTSDGKEIYRELHGGFPMISPKGRFIVFTTPQGWRLLNTAGKKAEMLPKVSKSAPMTPTDDGVVPYSWSPGKPGYRYTVGKGLKKTRDR